MTSCIGVLHDVANRRTNTSTCLRQAAALHYTTKLCKLHNSFSFWTTVCRHVILNSYDALVMASELSQVFINAKKHTGSKGYKKGMVAVASQPQCHQQNTHDSYSSIMTTVTVAAWWCTHTHARTHARTQTRTHAHTHTHTHIYGTQKTNMHMNIPMITSHTVVKSFCATILYLHTTHTTNAIYVCTTVPCTGLLSRYLCVYVYVFLSLYAAA